MPPAGIQVVADTSQFTAPLAEASKAALNVAASAEEARQRIVQAYQQQVKAAQDAGASQERLATIANRTASRLAEVTDDNARRYINAVDRMEDRTRRFNAALESLGAVVQSPIPALTDVSHTTVTQVQAASASLRELNGNFANNTRAVERFITTIPGVGAALQFAFPLIGGLAFGAMIAEQGTRLAEFIEKANDMAKAIKGDFDSMNLAAHSSNDALRLTDDLLQNHIDKLTGKPENNLAIAIDEARIKADDLAKSLENDAAKVKQLLAQNGLGAFAATITGQARTTSTAGSINSFQSQLAHLGVLNSDAVHQFGANSPQAQQTQKDIHDKQVAYDNWLTRRNAVLNNPDLARGDELEAIGGFGSQDANKAIVTGAQDALHASIDNQAEQARNGQLVAEEKAAQAAADAARRTHEAALKAAEEFRLGLEADAAVAKAWQAYENNNAKILSEDTLDRFKTSGLSEDDTKQLNQAGKDSAARIAALSQSIVLNKQDSQAQAEAILQMQLATGQITKLDAARVTAAMHLQQYNEAMAALREQAANIQTDPQFNDRPEARQAAAQANANQQTALTDQFRIQSARDSQNVNPASSSGVVGVEDALNEFADAVRNTSATLKQFTNSALSGINKNAVDGLFGQRTNFRGLGLDLARQGTGALLGKAEGGILSGLGFGGAPNGTQSNPLYVRIANAVSGAFGGGSSGSGSNDDAGSSPLGGLFNKGSGGVGGFFKGLLGGGGGSSGTGFDGLDAAQGIATGAGDAATDSGSGLTDLISTLPGLAIGGGADANSSYLVGERGPEILTMGTQPGRVIPNSQIGGVTHNHYYDINAQGSNDPAALHAAVRKAIPQAVAASTQVQHQRNLRRPQKG